MGAYGNPTAEIIIAIFALLFSLNFGLYFLLLQRRFKEALKSDEARFFLLLVAGSTALITINIMPIYENVWDSLRYAFFQVASIISTTGFATADFVLWPHFSQMILVILMFCGACAGSTGGGIKCSRVVMLLRSIRFAVEISSSWRSSFVRSLLVSMTWSASFFKKASFSRSSSIPFSTRPFLESGWLRLVSLKRLIRTSSEESRNRIENGYLFSLHFRMIISRYGSSSPLRTSTPRVDVLLFALSVHDQLRKFFN